MPISTSASLQVSSFGLQTAKNVSVICSDYRVPVALLDRRWIAGNPQTKWWIFQHTMADRFQQQAPAVEVPADTECAICLEPLGSWGFIWTWVNIYVWYCDIVWHVYTYIHTHNIHINIYIYSIIFNTAKLGRNIWGPLKLLRYWPIPMCLLFVFFLWYHVSFCVLEFITIILWHPLGYPGGSTPKLEVKRRNLEGLALRSFLPSGGNRWSKLLIASGFRKVLYTFYTSLYIFIHL